MHLIITHLHPYETPIYWDKVWLGSQQTRLFVCARLGLDLTARGSIQQRGNLDLHNNALVLAIEDQFGGGKLNCCMDSLVECPHVGRWPISIIRHGELIVACHWNLENKIGSPAQARKSLLGLASLLHASREARGQASASREL